MVTENNRGFAWGTVCSRSVSFLLPIVRAPYFLPACFTAYLLLRLAVLILLPLTPVSDAEWYVERGMELAAGEGYHQGEWPTAFWPIGYPLFLAAVFFVVGHHVLFAQLANLALSCGIFVLTYRLTFRIFRDEAAARIAVLLLTIYPNHIGYTGVLLSEMLGTCVFLLACDIFIGRPTPTRAAFAGLFLGYGALIKAQFLLLPALFLLLHGWRHWHLAEGRRKLAILTCILAATTVAVVAPLTIRNYLVLGRFVLISTNGGEVFLNGNNPEARGDEMAANSLAADAHITVEDQVDADKRAYALATNWIKRHPIQFLKLLPLKVLRLWAWDGDSEWVFQRSYADYDKHETAFRIVRVLNQIYYFGLLAAAAGAVILLSRRSLDPSPWAFLGLLFSLYLTLIAMVYFGTPRFHLPAVPFIVMYDGVFLSWLAGIRANTAAGAAKFGQRPVSSAPLAAPRNPAP